MSTTWPKASEARVAIAELPIVLIGVRKLLGCPITTALLDCTSLLWNVPSVITNLMEILLSSLQTIEQPVDFILPIIASAVAEWKVKNTPEVVKKLVMDALEKQSNSLTLRLLGFNCNWNGNWEVDHCNGRAGESAIGDHMKKSQSAAIQTWLETVTMPELTPAQLKKLQKDTQFDYYRELERALRDVAHEKAQTDAKTLIDQISKSMQIDGYLKTMALIEPKKDT